MGDMMATAFWVPFVVQFVMSAAMAHVWNILNTLRLVNTFALFQINMPANTKEVLLAFNKIANMKLFNSSQMYDSIGEYFVVEESPDNSTAEVPE